MFHRLSSFHVDYHNESHLIIPFLETDDSMIIHSSDKGIIYINAYNHLYVISPCFDEEIIKYINIYKPKIAIYPCNKNPNRYLLKRNEIKQGGVYSLLNHSELKEIATFYQEESDFDSEVEYLEALKPEESEFALFKDDKGKIISALYTVKKRELAVNIATKKEERNKGLATTLINNLPFSYIFCEEPDLLPFYEHLGFKIVNRYRVWRNKKWNMLCFLL